MITSLNKKLLIILLLLLQTAFVFAQNCTVNAGGNAIICGSTTTLTGGISGSYSVNAPLWTFVSGPVVPAIVTPNSLTTNITGMVSDGNYVFQLSHPCNTGTATSQVTITAHPRPASFTAGPDITTVCATTGITSLAGVIPAGFTGEWRAVNIYSLERFNILVATNSQFSNVAVANPTFQLINKASHEIDPAYYVILRIISLDNVCSYEDTAIVRFVPNPIIVPPLNTSVCRNPANTRTWIDMQSTSPAFATNYLGSAGTVANGTTVTLNVLTQPSGANMVYEEIESRRIYFGGMTVDGTYTFTLTVSNSCGTYTTPTITYTFSGTTPRQVSFIHASHPEQYAAFSFGGSGGELHCSTQVGTTAPENFYFTINPLDPPTVVSTVTPTGVIPPGGAPTISIAGAGTYNRVATVTPPAGGWRIGTYRFGVSSAN